MGTSPHPATPAKATMLVHTPPLSKSPGQSQSRHPGDTRRHAAGDTHRPTPKVALRCAVRKGHKQRGPRPPQKGHPLNPGCTVPACTHLVRNAWSVQDQGQPPMPASMLSSLSYSCSVLAALPGSLQACAPLCPLRGPTLPSSLCPLHPTFPNWCPS